MTGVNRRPYQLSDEARAIFERVAKVDLFTAWVEDLMTIHEEDGMTDAQAAAYIRERTQIVKAQSR